MAGVRFNAPFWIWSTYTDYFNVRQKYYIKDNELWAIHHSKRNDGRFYDPTETDICEECQIIKEYLNVNKT